MLQIWTSYHATALMISSSLRRFRDRKIELRSSDGEIPELRRVRHRSVQGKRRFRSENAAAPNDEPFDDRNRRSGPGRIDVQIEFKHCNFTGFKSLANAYLGVKEHKLFSQIEEIFESSSLSPAEIGEIMIANRNSPSRALKSVISAMQNHNNSKNKRSASVSESSSAGESEGGGAAAGVICRESVHTVREFRKLYGLLKMGSRRKEESPLTDYSSVLDNNSSNNNKDKEQQASKHAS